MHSFSVCIPYSSVNHMASFLSLIPLIMFVIFLIKWFYVNSSSPQKKLMPSPPKFPVIGNLHQLGLLPHRSLQSLARKYGQIMQIHLGSRPVVVISSADGARQIMKNHDLIFSSRPKSSIPDRLLYGSKDVAFTPYGEYWRQVRSISVLQLLSNKRVQSFRQVREEETSKMVEKIRQKCCSLSPLIDLSETLVTLTNDIICRIALGRKYSDQENGSEIRAAIREFAMLLGFFDVRDYIPRLGWVNRFTGLDAKVQRVAKEIDDLMEGVIEEHRNRKKENTKSDDGAEVRESDFVDILLEVQRDNSTGFAVQRDTLKAVIMDMFAAGTDTTHTVMEWVMAELLRHPKVLERLQIEVRSVAQGKPEVTEDDLEKMTYLKAVIKETLRLHSPVPLLVPRESTRDTQVMGYDIPAGTQVFVNAWAIGRDPQLWEKSEEFQPDRFLNSKIDFRGLNFELIPFGAGRRGCPGISFAIAVNELVLAKLLREFNFELPNGAKPEDLDMGEAKGIAIHKKLPLYVVATPHSL